MNHCVKLRETSSLTVSSVFFGKPQKASANFFTGISQPYLS